MVTLLLGCGRPQRPAQVSDTAKPSAGSLGLFRDMAATAGLNFRWGHSTFSHLTILDTVGYGCAFLDYDGDGRLDILLVGKEQCRLYRNTGVESRESRVESGTAPRTPAFEEVTAHAFPGAPSLPHLQGCAVADYDNDGYPDIFVTGYGRTILYHNETGNREQEKGKREQKAPSSHPFLPSSLPPFFKEVTRGSGLEARGPYDWTTSAAWADVDSDGRLDLYVCRYVQFTPATRQLCSYPGLDGSVVNMACGPTTYAPQKGSLYHNEGGGRFRDITQQAGLGDAQGNALGAIFCDFNDDGKPDLYIANDRKAGDLYVNLGHGRFKNIAVESGTAYDANGNLPSGMGLDWGDYDNDGRFDLVVATFQAEPKNLYHNEGGSRFTEMSYQSGLGAASLLPLAFGASFVDVDNDGLLDIVFTNGHVLGEVEKTDRNASYPQSSSLFRNLGGGAFRDGSEEVGPDFARKIVGRGIAVGDYDNDGRLDLLIVDAEGAPLLLHNEGTGYRKQGTGNRRDSRLSTLDSRLSPPPENHWLSLRCLRAPGDSDAVGARVTVSAGGRKQVGEVRAGGSYLSTNAPQVHFGLGSATTAETVEVRWPGGKTRLFRRLAADRAYSLTPTP